MLVGNNYLGQKVLFGICQGGRFLIRQNILSGTFKITSGIVQFVNACFTFITNYKCETTALPPLSIEVFNLALVKNPASVVFHGPENFILKCRLGNTH